MNIFPTDHGQATGGQEKRRVHQAPQAPSAVSLVVFLGVSRLLEETQMDPTPHFRCIERFDIHRCHTSKKVGEGKVFRNGRKVPKLVSLIRPQPEIPPDLWVHARVSTRTSIAPQWRSDFQHQSRSHRQGYRARPRGEERIGFVLSVSFQSLQMDKLPIP